MLKNYIKIAWRNLQTNKLYSSITIIGLTIGLLSCLLVGTVVVNELSYDRSWGKSEQIYRIITTNEQGGTTSNYSPEPLGPELQNAFPEVESYCRITSLEGDFKYQDGVFRTDILRTEETVWDMLDFNILSGNPQIFQDGQTNLVITKKLKDTYFPDTNPIGKVIQLVSNMEDPEQVMITGIIEEIPENSIFRAEALLIKKPRAGSNTLDRNGASTWNEQFLLLSKEANASAVFQKVNSFFEERMKDSGWKLRFEGQPLQDIYLNSNDLGGQKIQGSKTNVIILSAVAIMILVIGCINFINLTTASISKRIQATGIRKILGAGKHGLFAQYMLESLLYFTLSLVAALVLYALLLNPLNQFLNAVLALTLFNNLVFAAVAFVVLTLVGLLTGIYPALLLSSPKPNAVLGKAFGSKRKADVYRKALVVTQFTITVGVLVGTVAINKQIEFLNKKDLGYNEKNLLQIGFTYWGDKGEAFKNTLNAIGGVEQASITTWQPGVYGGGGSVVIEDPLNEGDMMKVWIISGDADLAQTLKLRLVEGEFVEEAKNDSLSAENKDKAILTEYTAKRLGVEKLNESAKGLFVIPVGIVKNFNNESLRNVLAPTIIYAKDRPDSGQLLVRLAPNAPSGIITKINEAYAQFYPDATFDYTWVSETLAAEFAAEQKLKDMLFLFSILTVALSCLGLFGLITFMVENRVKEISIRKVLGASMLQITTLLSRGSILLVLISIVIAVPVTWYILDKWLRDFPYRIAIDAWLFVKGGVVALAIALATLCVRTIKASMQNPADNLRNE